MAGDPPTRPLAASRSPFFGRDHELEELSAALDAAIAGRGSLFLLTGEAGIGKTRLVDRFTETIRERGAVSLWGRSWEGEGAPPFWCWIQILRAYLRGRDRPSLEAALPFEMAAVSRMVPPASQLGSAPPSPAADSEQERFEQFQAIVSFFAEASASEPIVLVLDDLHAADLPSLLLLRFMARTLRDMRLLVVAAAREPAAGLGPEARAVMSDLVREGTHLPIFGLDEAAVARFLPSSPNASPPPSLVRQIHEATDGNPFFVQEIARSLGSSPSGSNKSLRIPPGLQAALRQRLGPLSPSTHDVLSIAAVVGREFSVAFLQEISERFFEQIVSILDAARLEGIVTEASTPGVYRFAHGLFREMFYADVQAGRRLDLHRAVGQHLLREAAAGARPLLAEIAHHLVQAAPIGTANEAIEYSCRAGEAANAQLAYEDAVLHFERAVQVLQTYRPGEDRREAEALLALAEALRRAGSAEKTRETFLRAAEAARRCGATELETVAALRLHGRWAQEVAAGAETVALFSEILAKLPEESALRATVLSRLVHELMMANEPERCQAMAAEAVASAERAADPAARAYARNTWLWAFRANADPADVVTGGSEILELALSVGDGELALRGHDWRIIGFLELGMRTKLDAEIEAMERLVTRLRQPYYRWNLALVRAMVALLEGRLAEAETLASEALQLGQPFEPTNAVLFFGVQLFHLRREQGRLEELDQMFEEFARQHGTALPALRFALAFLHAQRGRHAEAKIIVDDLWREGIQGAFRGIDASSGAAMIAETVVLLGDARRAAELYEMIEPAGERGIVVGNAFVYFGSVARILALLAVAAGQEERAIAWFERALTIHRRMRARPFIARTAIEYGALLRKRNSPGAAAKAAMLIAEGEEIATQLGMSPVVPAASNGGEPAAATPPDRAVFRFEGSHWRIEWNGRAASFPDRLGFRYVARLLSSPGTELHAGELTRGETDGDGGSVGDERIEIASGLGHAGEILDSQAAADYRSRVQELRAEIADAERENREGDAIRLREELDFIARELAAAHGLGGRRKKAVDTDERMRKAVRNRIRNALELIADQHEPLGRHLANSIRTGIFCSYEPEEPIEWST